MRILNGKIILLINYGKILAPSILAGNHAHLTSALKMAESDGRKWIHLDIMDGHFVPNLSFGPKQLQIYEPNQIFFLMFI